MVRVVVPIVLVRRASFGAAVVLLALLEETRGFRVVVVDDATVGRNGGLCSPVAVRELSRVEAVEVVVVVGARVELVRPVGRRAVPVTVAFLGPWWVSFTGSLDFVGEVEARGEATEAPAGALEVGSSDIMAVGR